MMPLTENVGMSAKSAIKSGLKHITLPTNPSGSEMQGNVTPLTQASTGLKKESLGHTSLQGIGTANIANKFLPCMARNASLAEKQNKCFSPLTTLTMMAGICAKTKSEKTESGCISIYAGMESGKTSKFYVSTATLENSVTAESLLRIAGSREGATTRAKARRTKRFEAPGLAKASDDMVSSAGKPVAARKSGNRLANDLRRFSTFFNQVCGNTAQSDTKYTGLNTVTAPSSDRRIWPNGRTTDQSIDSNDPFTLDLIDRMVTIAKIGSNRVRPIKIGGKNKYIVYLHPAQVEDLRTNSASGQWNAIRQAAMQGGDITENDIYTGALGEHNGCILRESQDVTKGVHSTAGTAVDNTRRAVLLGAQAACMANKKYKNGQMVKWNEEQFDHGREVEMTAFKVWGLKKTIYDSSDFGTIVCTTYSDQ